MNTLLFSGCYLEGDDLIKNDRLERNIRYVDYYSDIQNYLGFEKIFLLDNGSSYLKVNKFMEKVNKKNLDFVSLENLSCVASNDYPYCWRALYYTKEHIKNGYEKIIMIDSDGFVLTKKFCEYIKKLNSGWTTFWCPRWEFPDASINILCKDAFHLFDNYTMIDYKRRIGSVMELSLPFTHIDKSFVCDRFGETDTSLSDDIDYYGQAGPNFKPRLI